MNHNCIKDSSGRNAHTSVVMRALGLKPGGHLPDEGMPPRFIGVVWVWVTPAQTQLPGFERKSSTHRVMGECPSCGRHMSVGRMHQHKCTHHIEDAHIERVAEYYITQE